MKIQDITANTLKVFKKYFCSCDKYTSPVTNHSMLQWLKSTINVLLCVYLWALNSLIGRSLPIDVGISNSHHSAWIIIDPQCTLLKLMLNVCTWSKFCEIMRYLVPFLSDPEQDSPLKGIQIIVSCSTHRCWPSGFHKYEKPLGKSQEHHEALWNQTK